MNALLMASGGLPPIVDAPVWVVMLLKMTAILAIAWLAHLALKRTNPRWRVFLWRVTAVGLIALPAVAWLLPALKISVEPPPAKEVATVAPVAETPLFERTVGERAPMHVSDHMPDARAMNLSPLHPSAQPEAVASSASPPDTPALAPPKPSPITWPMLLLAAWLGGIAILGFRLCLGHYRISAIARHATPVAQPVRSECMRVAQAIGCRCRVEVMHSADVESPFLCGLRRPLLLLPARMCEASYCKDLPGILAHELTHLRSHDVPWNVGLQLISIVLWFHPLMWRMRKAHLAACELVSDAASASFVGDVSDYCRTLARVAVDACGALPAAGIAMARTSAIRQRLIALKTRGFHLPLRRPSVIAFGCAALLAVFLIGALQFALAAPPEAEPAAPASDVVAGAVEKSANPARSSDATPSDDSVRISAVDGNGKPISGARVKLEGRNTTLTAESITVKHPANFQAEEVTVATDSPKGTIVFNAPSLRVDEPRGKPLPVRTIHGKVVDDHGKPIAGADVWMMQTRDLAHKQPATHTTTDAAGRFSVLAAPVLSERELQRPWYPHHREAVWAYAPGRQVGTGSAEDQMYGRNKADVVIQLGPPADIAFTVLGPDGKPKAAALVEPDRVTMKQFGALDPPDEVRAAVAVRTNAEGRAVLTALPRNVLGSMRVVTADLGVQSQEVPAGGKSPDQTIRLRPVGKIVGRVTAVKSKWARGVRILLTTMAPQDPRAEGGDGRPMTLGSADVVSDEQGRFVASAIAAGKLSVSAIADDALPVLPRTPQDRSIEVNPRKTTNLEIPLEPSVLVHGTVRAKDTGRPLTGMIQFSYGDDLGQGGLMVCSDAQGNFAYPVLPGPIQWTVFGMPDKHSQLYLQNGDEPAEQQIVPANVKEFTIPPIELMATKSIPGRLIDQHDQPVAKRRIWVNVPPGYGWATSDAKGEFVLTCVPTNIDAAKVGYQTERVENGQSSDSLRAEIVHARPLLLRVRLSAPTTNPVGAAGNNKAKPAERESQPDKRSDAAPKAGLLRVLVLDSRGQPLPGVNVHASIWTEEKGVKANHDYKTDPQGQAVVNLPKTFFIVRLFVTKDTFVPLFQGWEQEWFNAGNRLPENFTFKLRKGTVIGGIVKNDAGQPIPGVKVEVMCEGGNCLTWLADGGDARVTDSQGRWTLDDVPEGDAIKVSLRLNHPDYISDKYWGGLQSEQDVALAALRAQKAAIVMHRGIALTGTVTDADGKPLAAALVAWGDDPYFEFDGRVHEVRTNSKGVYWLPPLPVGPMTVTVMAEGWAPDLKKVKVARDAHKVDFQLKAGKAIRLRFVDIAGKPIPGVQVLIESWRGGKSLYNIKHPNVLDSKIPETADENGVWEWTWAPDDAVKLRAYSYPLKGYAPCDLEIAGGAPPRTVALKPEHRITGRVSDAVTGKPIPLFTVIPIDVFRKDWLEAERMNAKVGKDGRLDYLADRTDIPLRLRIEAAGYRTQTGPEFRVGDDTPRTQDFRLQPSKPITGTVLDAAGKPVTKAAVLLATPTEEVRFGDRDEDSENHKAVTDAAGHFAFPDTSEPFAVLAQSDAGFAMADFPADQHDAETLRLQAWASVRGRFLDGGKPVKNASVFLNLIRLDSLDRPRVDTNSLQVRTDKDGRFQFPRVPPLPFNAEVLLGPWRDEGFRSAPNVPLDLKPGQSVELKLGESGAAVLGKVKLTGRVPADLDCSYSLNYLIRREPGIAPPPAIAKMGFDVRKGWQSAWHKSQEGRAYLSTLQHWFVKLAPDGAFRISGVPAGEYDLTIEIYAKPTGCLVDPLAKKTVTVTVTAEDAAHGELSLPQIAVTVVPIPAVGDTPSLSFQRADGSDGSLADFRGHYTVVQFWASWCGTCKQHAPALRQQQEQFAARGLTMLGLSLDDDVSVWQAALKQIDLPWQQGRIAAADAVGVSSVPAYWLLDPAGKIVAKVNELDALAAAVDKSVKAK